MLNFANFFHMNTIKRENLLHLNRHKKRKKKFMPKSPQLKGLPTISPKFRWLSIHHHQNNIWDNISFNAKCLDALKQWFGWDYPIWVPKGTLFGLRNLVACTYLSCKKFLYSWSWAHDKEDKLSLTCNSNDPNIWTLRPDLCMNWKLKCA